MSVAQRLAYAAMLLSLVQQGVIKADGLQLPDALLPQTKSVTAERTEIRISHESGLVHPRHAALPITLHPVLPTSRPAASLKSATAESDTSNEPATGELNGQQSDRGPLASALFLPNVATANPYGDMQDTRGLRPCKPGVRYERSNRDGNSLFGSLFGR